MVRRENLVTNYIFVRDVLHAPYAHILIELSSTGDGSHCLSIPHEADHDGFEHCHQSSVATVSVVVLVEFDQNCGNH